MELLLYLTFSYISPVLFQLILNFKYSNLSENHAHFCLFSFLGSHSVDSFHRHTCFFGTNFFSAPLICIFFSAILLNCWFMKGLRPIQYIIQLHYCWTRLHLVDFYHGNFLLTCYKMFFQLNFVILDRIQWDFVDSFLFDYFVL